MSKERSLGAEENYHLEIRCFSMTVQSNPTPICTDTIIFLFFISTFHPPPQMSIYLVGKPHSSPTGMGVRGFYGHLLPALAVPLLHTVVPSAAGGPITRLPHWLLGALLHNVPYQALS